MIKLGYLKGYNSYNVPSFATKQARDTFFDSITGLVEIDAYYPPFYTNVIKLDITQVSQSVPYNFVILVHNNEYYYYFVDKFEYINEEVYKINIIQDTVLTTMFDVKVKDCVITRNSIKRWNNTKINRNYIRENLSRGFKEVKSFDVKSNWRFLIVKSSSFYDTPNDNDGRPIKYLFRKDDAYYKNGMYVYIIPLIPNLELGTITVKDISNTTIGSYSYNTDLFNYFITDPYVISMNIIESKFLEKLLKINYSSNVMTLYHVDINSFIKINSIDANNRLLCFALNAFSYQDSDTLIENLSLSIDTAFIKSTAINNLFNIKYIPQLIDENYMHLEYGDNYGFAGYPYHNLNETNIKLFNYTELVDCSQGYYMCENGNESKDIYNTYLFSLSNEYNLITDRWLQYKSISKGYLTIGLQTKMANELYRSVGSNLTGNPLGEVNALANLANIAADYKVTKDNLEYAPDISKGNYDALQRILGLSLKQFVRKFVVNDIEAVGRKLELYGYKQNISAIYSTSKYINEIENNRYYYNCLEIRINDYEISRFIPNDIMADFIERLSNGVRLFNMLHNTNLSDNLIYDNVETEEIIGV